MKRYTKKVEFRVEGSGTFPVDMLRYDCCWPATNDDAISVTASPADWPGKRQVLLHTNASPGKNPRVDITEGRWVSFGWNVLDARYV